MAYPVQTRAERAERAAPAFMGVVVVLGVASIGELLVAAVPPHLDETAWRFQILALLLSTAQRLTFPVVLLAVLGLIGGYRAAVKAAALSCMGLAAIILLALPFFALDFLAERHLQPQSRLGAFNRDGLRLVGTSVMFVLALGWAGIRGIAASMKGPASAADAPAGVGLIVGQPTPK